jgi:hypothetical protein
VAEFDEDAEKLQKENEVFCRFLKEWVEEEEAMEVDEEGAGNEVGAEEMAEREVGTSVGAEEPTEDN